MQTNPKNKPSGRAITLEEWRAPLPEDIPPPSAGTPVRAGVGSLDEPVTHRRTADGYTGPVPSAHGRHACPVCAMGYRTEVEAADCCSRMVEGAGAAPERRVGVREIRLTDGEKQLIDALWGSGASNDEIYAALDAERPLHLSHRSKAIGGRLRWLRATRSERRSTRLDKGVGLV